MDVAQRHLEDLLKLAKDLEVLMESDTEMSKRYQNVLDRMKTAIKDTAHDLERGISSESGGIYDKPEDNFRTALLQANEYHIAIDHSITETQRVLAETEQIGVGVGSRLRQQREQLVHVRDDLEETDDTLIRTRKILSQMGRRVMTDKMIQAVIIAVELAILGVILFLKLK